MKKTSLRVYKRPSRLLRTSYFEEQTNWRPHGRSWKWNVRILLAKIWIKKYFFPLVITEMFLFDGQKLDSRVASTHLTKPQIWHLSLACHLRLSPCFLSYKVTKRPKKLFKKIYINSVRLLALVVNVPISNLDVRLSWWCVNELHVRHLTDAKKLLNFILHAENYCLTKTWSDVFQSSRLGL